MSFELEMDNSKGTIHDILGVSDERQRQIKDIIIKCWREEDLVTDAMSGIAQKCNTLNELALAMMGLGQLMNELRR